MDDHRAFRAAAQARGGARGVRGWYPAAKITHRIVLFDFLCQVGQRTREIPMRARPQWISTVGRRHVIAATISSPLSPPGDRRWTIRSKPVDRYRQQCRADVVGSKDGRAISDPPAPYRAETRRVPVMQTDDTRRIKAFILVINPAPVDFPLFRRPGSAPAGQVPCSAPWRIADASAHRQGTVDTKGRALDLRPNRPIVHGAPTWSMACAPSSPQDDMATWPRHPPSARAYRRPATGDHGGRARNGSGGDPPFNATSKACRLKTADLSRDRGGDR